MFGSPDVTLMLANVYLHAVLDEWFEKEVKPRLKGNAFEVRYADDAALFFEYQGDAERVLEILAAACELTLSGKQLDPIYPAVCAMSPLVRRSIAQRKGRPAMMASAR
jgi:hypothetical protein